MMMYIASLGCPVMNSTMQFLLTEDGKSSTFCKDKCILNDLLNYILYNQVEGL